MIIAFFFDSFSIFADEVFGVIIRRIFIINNIQILILSTVPPDPRDPHPPNITVLHIVRVCVTGKSVTKQCSSENILRQQGLSIASLTRRLLHQKEVSFAYGFIKYPKCVTFLGNRYKINR